MRHLLQTRVLGIASGAACISTLACYPRLMIWLHRPAPVWYLEAVIFVCCIILWGFVFAWHQPYTGRPPFSHRTGWLPWAVATGVGIMTAVVFQHWLDPGLRAHFPEEYPPDLAHWVAMIPLILTLNLLFMVFAPFDWSLRLTKNPWVAAGVLGLWNAVVLAMKIHSLPQPASAGLLTALMAGRVASGFFVAWLYWRGGALPVCWWALLVESRHLVTILGTH